MDLISAAKRHVGVTLLAGAVLGTSAGVATAVAVAPTSASSDVYEAPETTAPASTSGPEAPVAVAPEAVPAPQSVEAVEPVTPPVNVQAVTTPEAVEPAPQPAAEQGVQEYDPTAPWVDSSGTTYAPAPDVPVEKLPGEAGWVPPAD